MSRRPCSREGSVRALFFWSAGKQRVWSRRNFAGNPRDNFNAGISQGDSLAGIICEKANTLDTAVVQYRGPEAEISAAPSGRGSPKDAGSRTYHFFYSPSQRLVRNISAVVVSLVRSRAISPLTRSPEMGDRVAGEGRYGADA
jgi:hypothetical protein